MKKLILTIIILLSIIKTEAQCSLFLAANNTTICAGTSVILAVAGATSYTWYPGALSGSTIAVSPTTNTTYTVYGSSGTCTAATTSSVTVVQFPYTGNSATITCSNPVASIPLSTTVSPVTCVWDNNPGLISGGNTLNPSVYFPDVYTFTLTNTMNGCATTGSATVVSNTIMPGVMISTSSYSICAGQTATLTASSTGSVNYSWFPSTGLSSTTSSVVGASPVSGTIYTITANDPTNGCSSFTTISIGVSPNPIITVTNATICVGSSASLIANGAASYTWSPPFNLNSTSGPIVYANPNSSTVYTVQGSIGGCIEFASVNVNVNQTCQDVWPGDANSDGVTDNLDVLELGLHYTQSGTPRSVINNSWQSYFSNNWSGTIANGKNLNHSDCNGDGIINNNDTLAIYSNYGLNHSFKPSQTTTVNAQLSIVPDQAMVAKGTWGSASIYLGNLTTSINNLNGIAFTVNFDNTLIETNNIYIEYQNSFLDVGQNLRFRKLDFANSKIYTATTHTINNNVSGYGKIATLHYQILSSLTTDQILNLNLVQANQSDALGTITPLTTGAGTLMAIGASVGLAENSNTNLISIHPNPTNGLLSINSKSELQKIEVVTITGQMLLIEAITSNNYTLHLENYSNGIYFVNIYQNNKIVRREKVIINK
jgi:hypothetical protein